MHAAPLTIILLARQRQRRARYLDPQVAVPSVSQTASGPVGSQGQIGSQQRNAVRRSAQSRRSIQWTCVHDRGMDV
jgi:hypothetical protein